MPWKNIEVRKAHRRKLYSEQKSLGIKRNWGKIEAECPICGKCRFITKNTHGITKLLKNEFNRIVRRCRSCSKVKIGSKYKDLSLLRDEQKRQRRGQKIKAIKYLGNKCKKCGYEYNGKNAYAFDFHHRNPQEKDFLPASKVYNWQKCVSELNKCDLLCAICHRKEHSEEY